MSYFRRGSIFFSAVFFMTAISAFAADYTWIGGHGMDFNEPTNWDPTGVPNSGDESAAIQNGAVVNLDAANTVSALSLGPGTLNLNAGGNLTTGQVLGTGIIGFSGGTLTASANNSNFLNTANFLSTGGATINTQNNNVTVAGAFHDLGGGITGDLTKIGSGQLNLTAVNNYSGSTIIGGGILQADDGAGLSANSLLKLDGGVLQCATSTLKFIRSLGSTGGAFQWTANGGGFSNGGTGEWKISVGGNVSPPTLAWGDDVGTQIVGTLKLSSPSALGCVTIVNDIDLGNADRTIEVNNPDTGGTYRGTLSGTISGSGGIVKNGPGRLMLTGNSTYTGTTTLNQGFFANYASHQPTGKYVVNGGTMCYCGKSPDKIDGLKITGGDIEGLGGSIIRCNTNYDVQGGNIYCITLTDGVDGDNNPISVGLTKTGTGVAKLECTCTYTGPTRILEGTLELCAYNTTKYTNKVGQIGVSSQIITADNTLLLISDDQVHTVGAISGTGTTQVCSGATLKATSIEQDTLIIGGSRPVLPGEAAASVPEPSASLLLAMAGLASLAIGVFGKRRR